MKQESLFIEFNSTESLHLRRIYKNKNGPPVLMVHGAIENGRIFYSEDGKGLGPYLASQGFDVFVGDLRGRGGSIPPINCHSSYGQTEAITEEIPAFANKIRELKGDVPQHWMAHSWGGVLLLSTYARISEVQPIVKSMTFFATKRSISVFNLKKFLMVDLLWYRLTFLISKLWGYVPAKQLRFGADNETKDFHRQIVQWAKPSKWIDDDGFDYAKAINELTLPPTFHLVGINDAYLGHPKDVKDLIEESGNTEAKFQVLSKKNGNLHDYGHTDILTHPNAVKDHFPLVLSWLKENYTDSF